MGMPSIQIAFTELAASAIRRGDRGIIAMILKDTLPEGVNNPVVLTSNGDIPAGISEANKTQLKLALMGYVNPPKKVIAYFLPADAADYEAAFTYFASVKFTYLVVPTVTTDAKTADVVSYVKDQRANNKLIKAVLPNVKADSEAIINVTTTSFIENDKTFTTEQYCSRIAGIIAGTPMAISATYAPLNELSDCTHLSVEDMDKAVDAGEFIVFWDGEKVKTGRAVNSLTTLAQGKNVQFQKIKVVETMDMIADDIRTTAEDNYIGKYANTYDNKCLLLSAIGNYFRGLVDDDVLASYSINIDVEANKKYLEGKGIDTSEMTWDDIKKANTGSFVYLTATVSIVDAIEDIVLPITI